MTTSNKIDDPDWTLTLWVGGKPGLELDTALESSRAYLEGCFQKQVSANSLPRKVGSLFLGSSSTAKRAEGWEGVHDQHGLLQVDDQGNVFKALQLRVTQSAVAKPRSIASMVPLMAILAVNELSEKCVNHGVKILAVHGPRFAGALKNKPQSLYSNNRWNLGMVALDPHRNKRAFRPYEATEDSVSVVLKKAAADLPDDASIDQVLLRALPLLVTEKTWGVHKEFATMRPPTPMPTIGSVQEVSDEVAKPGRKSGP